MAVAQTPECEPVALVKKRFVTNLQMLSDISKALIVIAPFTTRSERAQPSVASGGTHSLAQGEKCHYQHKAQLAIPNPGLLCRQISDTCNGKGGYFTRTVLLLPKCQEKAAQLLSGHIRRGCTDTTVSTLGHRLHRQNRACAACLPRRQSLSKDRLALWPT